jgi:hypothetical protein
MELESVIPVFISSVLIIIKIKSKLQSGLGLFITWEFIYILNFLALSAVLFILPKNVISIAKTF